MWSLGISSINSIFRFVPQASGRFEVVMGESRIFFAHKNTLIMAGYEQVVRWSCPTLLKGFLTSP